MTTVEAIIHVTDTDSEWRLHKSFASSPIRVGRDRRNDLRLQHPAVATFHGEIEFSSGFVAFRNLSRLLNVAVDGVEVPSLSTIALTETSHIALGPFRIEVQVRPVACRQDRPASDLTCAAPRAADGPTPSGPALRSRLCMRQIQESPEIPRISSGTLPPALEGRAAGLLAILGSGFRRLEPLLLPLGSPPLIFPDGGADIVECLLDPLEASGELLERIAVGVDELVSAASHLSASTRVVHH